MVYRIIITASVLLLFAAQPKLFRQVHGAVSAIFAKLARHPIIAIACAAALPLLIRLALLPVLPVPIPRIHDEFSYLLASDTFAHGRVTNPTHPLWEFFETIHVLSRPTYMSKYPPAQGLLMALGQVLFGHPWWGVFISIGLMCGSACWMLRGWLPPVWALLGSFAIGIEFGVTNYWMNSYWGGAPAAIGACLLLGSYARLRRFRHFTGGTVLYGSLLALGVAILLNSRPWEGLMISLPVACGLVYWLFKNQTESFAFRFRNVVLPGAAVLILTAASMMYYCWRITGNPLTLPYTVAHKTYSIVPLFVWQQPTTPPQYHHAIMQKFYTEWEPHYQNGDQLKTWRGWLSIEKARLRFTKDLLFGNFFLLLCCAAVPFFWRKRSIRFLMWVFAAFMVGLSVQGWCQDHYFGPVLGAAFILQAEALRRVSVFKLGGKRWGMALCSAIILCCVVKSIQHIKPEPIGGWPLQRARIQKELERAPGLQLVIVRYDSTHNPIWEWVYNKADIDAAKVVWARDMSPTENQKLLTYFKGRHVWLIQPDVSYDLQPIPENGITSSNAAHGSL